MNAQRINPDADEGFMAKPLTADLARQQLHMSIGVMGVVVGAALALLSTFGMAPAPAALQLRSEATVQQPHFLRPLTAQAPQADGVQSGG